jgi:hypothetical protein
MKRAVGFPITTTQTIYFYDKSAVGPCYVGNFLITINPSPAIDARPIEVLKCDANFVLDDLGNGEYYEFAGGPSSTNPVLEPGLVITTSKDYMFMPAATPNNCTKEYAIDVFITKVNTIEDQYACDSYSLPAIVGQGDYYTASGGPNGGGIKLSLPYSVSTTTSLYVYAEDNSSLF